MTTWDNGDIIKLVPNRNGNFKEFIYTINGIIGDTGGTLTTNFDKIEAVQVQVETKYGSETIYTATGDGNVGGITIVNTAHTQANDYWNQHVALMVGGAHAGEAQTITDFDAASDTLTTNAFTGQIMTGETYKIINTGYTTDLVYCISGSTVVVAYTNPAGAHIVRIIVSGT
jgi:hypothetical protein